MNISKDRVVTLQYEVRDGLRHVIEKSPPGKPLSYLHGRKQIVAGLEKALENREKGDRFTATVSPEEGYGEYDPNLMRKVPRSLFEKKVKTPTVGMMVQLTGETPPVWRVTHFDRQDVILDANHALAGETLFFEVEILEVREATSAELAHGHAHPPGHEHHEAQPAE